MFNQLFLVVLVTLSLCAIYVSAVPPLIFRRQGIKSHYEDSSDVKAADQYKYQKSDGINYEDGSVQIALLDDDSGDWKVVGEVAETDYVPKHVYENENEQLDRKNIETVQMIDDEEGDESEDHLVESLFSHDEEIQTNERRKQEKLTLNRILEILSTSHDDLEPEHSDNIDDDNIYI